MTVKQIEEKQALESIVFDTAKKIRQLLDEAKKQYGAAEWDEADRESAVLELVTEEA